MSKKYFVLIIIFLILLAGGVSFRYFNVKPNKPVQTYLQQYNDAAKLHHAGELNKSIQMFENTLKYAPNKSSAVQTNLKLAFDLYQRNERDDRILSVNIYKSIISDTTVSNLQRAIAISDLMGNLDDHPDKKFAKNFVFKDEPFGTFLAKANSLGYKNDLVYAKISAYQMAEKLFPLALNEFKIARLYLAGLENNYFTYETLAAGDIISYFKEWTLKGESNLPASLHLGYEKSKIGLMYMLDGINRAGIAKYTNDESNYKLAEISFKNGLAALSPEADSVHTFGSSMYIRFYYASMLADVYGESRKADIANLLQPIIAGPPAEFKNYPFTFFSNIKTASADSVFKKKALNLVKLAPEFSKVLSP